MPKPVILSDSEVERRSVYTRLYRAHLEDSDYYPAAFLSPRIVGELAAAGHIQAAGRGYLLTEDGINHWCQLAKIRRGKRVIYATTERKKKAV